jgi:alkanesulfonate monooxygenase SsuD/methylene tetrahydromethanopterin reductase-like flavin-dependent oxidoreductase (luciferase family)
VNDVRLNVTPVQRPHPPIWVAVLRTEAVPLVGARGWPVMMIPYAATEQIEELGAAVSAFRTAFVGAGGRIGDATVPFGLHTYCAEDVAQARADAKPAMDRYVRTRLYAKQRPFERLVDKDLVAFGAPDDLIRIARRYESLGLTHFLAIMNFGGLDHARVLRSMERMAKHVLPAFAG